MKRTAFALILALTGCATAEIAPPVVPAAPVSGTVPAAMQWLYGSGEGAASSLQTYRAFRAHVLTAARSRPDRSVVLAAEASPGAPNFVPCGDKPLAVILDVDETAIQNLGYEYDEARRGRPYDADLWARWEESGANAVAPMPGAVETLTALRAAGITVVFNSNRLARYAPMTEAALVQAGLGPARHGETLFLKGDIGPGSEKDGRRAAIADRFCVIAMAGDQLGDFSDHFNRTGLSVTDRRQAAAGRIGALWGAGWFILANPVYGPALRGGLDDVFPSDRRWSDPQGD